WYNVLYLILRRPRSPTLFPYTTLFRSGEVNRIDVDFCIPHILSCQPHAKLISDMCEVVGMLQPLNGSSDDFVQARVIRIIQQSRSEEHTSELQSRENLVCRLMLEIKNR